MTSADDLPVRGEAGPDAGVTALPRPINLLTLGNAARYEAVDCSRSVAAEPKSPQCCGGGAASGTLGAAPRRKLRMDSAKTPVADR